MVSPTILTISLIAVTAVACSKNSTANTGEASAVVAAIDKVEKVEQTQGSDTAKPTPASTAAGASATTSPQPPAAPKPATGADTPEPASDKAPTPIPGLELGKLDQEKIARFYQLIESLPSPCGKAHSLRTSITKDSSCKRAPFAVRYLLEMLSDEVSDGDAKEFYNRRYKEAARQTFQLSASVPHSGPVDAPVSVVEFYDYGCPSCKLFAPILREAMSHFPNEAVVYYKQFPLSAHVHSKGAAQAALAAHKQGKFKEMDHVLFARAPNHRKPELIEYAKAIGLDIARFEADFVSALPQVEKDLAEGNKAGVHGTPTTYINGRMYEGPYHPKYVRLWIEEEVAVNR